MWYDVPANQGVIIENALDNVNANSDLDSQATAYALADILGDDELAFQAENN